MSPRSPCSHLGARERGSGNFPSSVPGDSEESKVCSKLVLLLLSLLLLSRGEQRLGRICLPHTLAWSHVLTACLPLHLRTPGICPGPAPAWKCCLSVVVLFHMKMPPPLGGPVSRGSGGLDTRFRSRVAACGMCHKSTRTQQAGKGTRGRPRLPKRCLWESYAYQSGLPRFQ